MECEFGSTHPIGIANVKAYDDEGNEIETPKCTVCGMAMQCLIGKEVHAWHCWNCTRACDNG